MPRYFAIIPAAGTGSRMAGMLPKQYREIGGHPLLYFAIARLCAHAAIDRVFIALAPGDAQFDRYDWKPFASKLTSMQVGGDTRAATVLNALEAFQGNASDDDWILVHDAARPCLSEGMLDRLIAELADDDCGGLLSVPVADTLKRTGANERSVVRTESRSGLWQAQTPQMFRYGVLLQAMRSADPGRITDEAGAIEALGFHPKLVQSDVSNLKVTHEQDLALAQLILEQGDIRESNGVQMRTGQGYDVHALVPGRALIIGGVTIPFAKGLDGHSDADVLLHAICDALLGAAALGDIGRHFPDTDSRYKGADSRVLLREVGRLVGGAGYRIVNVDSTIIAQAPKMAPHIPSMVANIAADLGIEQSQVNVKAKTTERLGFVGREEGMAADAIASLECHPRTGNLRS
jgi:2-C-methyl-D-erythritol 4-phosphate cytidylyltransferase/2-C-methyl-D-erythritol 2,4-cyclodiphosphate synthase